MGEPEIGYQSPYDPAQGHQQFDLNGNPIPVSPRADAPGPAPTPVSNRYNPNPLPAANLPYGSAPGAYNAPPGGVPPAPRLYGQVPASPSPYGQGAPPPPGAYGQPIPPPPYAYGQSQMPGGYGYPGQPPGSQPYSAQGAADATGYAGRPGSNTGVLLAIIGAVVFAIVLIALSRAAVPPKAVIPATYVPFTSPDNSFSCLAPGGWSVEGFGMAGGADDGGGVFKSGDAKISLTDSQAMSFAVGPDSDTPALIGTRPPAAQRLHDMMYSEVSDKFTSYQESAAQVYSSPLGDGRISEFTASGGQIHGYRVSVVGLNSDMEIYCDCAASEWEGLQPVFTKVLGSINAVPQQ